MSDRVPIETLSLFPGVNRALVDLLELLSPADWLAPTIHRDRSVKDLAAHLLDGSMRRLALQRDGWVGEDPRIASYQDLVDFVQRINREWMSAVRRLSPRMLIELIRKYDAELVEFLASRDADQPASFPVDWAGESVSSHWFDVAREYTEKWHHQQQIRDAVGRPGLKEPVWMRPVLETFLRALPHAYRAVDCPEGTQVEVLVEGPAGGRWRIERRAQGWIRAEGSGVAATATLSVEQDDGWRIFTKAYTPAQALERIRCQGPPELARPLASMVCILA